MELIEEKVNKVRRRYSNPNNFEQLIKEKLLLVNFDKLKYHVQSIESGELYACLKLSESPVLYYGKNEDGKINDILQILEKKYDIKIRLKQNIIFGLYEMYETINCFETPLEFSFRK
ncbi:MAG: hypothetical protein PHU51_04230 [Candidatus Nanoarchaeia archaeon]|nr:hypothetical protein [Candidatus Nanoarchaeia archaeon]